MSSRPESWVAGLGFWFATAVVILASAPSGAQPKIHLREVCGPQTVLTLVGADTKESRLLFAMRSEQPEIPGWLVDLDSTTGRATLHLRKPSDRRTGGSVAAGPVLTALPCGTACRQIEAWQGAGWTAVGPPISVPTAARLETGYDGNGRPWAVVIVPGGAPGRMQAAAFRLDAGIWRPQGRLIVESVGFPVILASPADPDAILVGSGRFAPDEPPGPWLRGIPANGTGSQVAPISDEAAVWLDDDGKLLISRDGGRTWRQSRRTRRHEVGGWVTELRADLPLHRSRGELPALWSARDGDAPGGWTLDLTSWTAAGGWRDVAQLPDAHPRGLSPDFEPQHIVVRGDGHWILVGACVDSPTGAALEVVTIPPQGRSEIVRPRLDPAWLTPVED